jgi:exodeoxyribonuclease V alpha subunit
MNEETNFSALDRRFGAFVERLHGSPLRNCAPPRCSSAAVVPRGTSASRSRNFRQAAPVGSGDKFTPLVLESGRLYLRRYWEYEQQLARAILHRAANSNKRSGKRGADLQQAAAANALTRNFSVITGGPGTGKTHTVITILSLLWSSPAAMN